MSTITIPKAGRIDVPDPPSISSIDFIKQVIDNVNAQMASLDIELEKACQGDTGHVKALFDSMHTIKSRAEQADMILLQLMADPAILKQALSKINKPAETFQKMKKLEAAVEELQKELKEAEYDYFSTVADCLIDVQSQMENFDSFVALPHISLIKRKIMAIESELRRQVQWIFREIGPLVSSESYDHDENEEVEKSSLDLSALVKIDSVVDALGEVFRKDLLGRFAQLQLIPYEKLFQFGTKYAGLDCLEHRFAWFKYLLRVVDSKFSNIFPVEWNAPNHLFIEFSRRTKKHLGEALAVLEKETHDTNSHVAFLLKSLKSVITFEAEMTASFAARRGAVAHGDGEEDDDNVELGESIRDAFDAYLGPYVQMERQGLEDLMAEVLQAEETAQGMAPSDPYESSRKMFEYIKNSLKRCTGFSTGITFLSLSKEFRICLQQYAESLKFRCPTPTFPKSPKQPVYRLTKTIESTLCRIIRTGEYCVDTVPALETMMKARIQKVYENEVDFHAQIDTFMDMVSFAMGCLASGEIYRMEDDFTAMRKISWGTLDNVGDVSPHIKKFLKVLTDCVPRIRLTMSSGYFMNICIKLATVFLDQFHENIMMLKRICMTGGGQLLLDLNGIKEFLLIMPNVRLPPDSAPLAISKVYLSVVGTKTKRIEAILKLVCTDDSMMDEMFALLWPDGTPADLEAVSNLKGTGRSILPLDTVQDAFKGGAKTALNTGTGAAKGIKTGLGKVGDGVKNAFGDIMNGNMFNDNSTHSNEDPHHSSSSRPSSTTASGLGNKAVGDIKHAFGGINAALGFKKAGAASTSTGNGSSSALKMTPNK